MLCDDVFNPGAKRWLQNLPERLRMTVEGVTNDILTGYPDVLAAVAVGSAAEGVHDSFSDIDYLYVRDPKIPNEVIGGIKKAWPLVHFIVHNPDKLSYHFHHCTTMAWSIKKGVVLFDPQGALATFMAQRLRMPSKEWLQSWASTVSGWPDGPRDLRHKVINFGILRLALLGVVPTTKHQLRSEFLGRIKDDALRNAVRIATQRGLDDVAETWENHVSLFESAVIDLHDIIMKSLA